MSVKTRFCKYKKIFLIFFMVFFIFFSLQIVGKDIAPCKAAVVWSDNFDDGNYDGWSVSGFNRSYGFAGETWIGNLSVDEDGHMRSGGEDFSCYTYARHASNVAYGTWSFDVCTKANWAHSHIFMDFILEDPLNPSSTVGYSLWIIALGHAESIPGLPYGRGFYLMAQNGGTDKWDTLDSSSLCPTGWHHIDITRDTGGEMNVYIDGNITLFGENNEIKTSKYFRMVADPGQMLDNISVTNTIDYDQVPPYLVEEILYHTIYLGDSYRYDLNVTDTTGVDTWWLESGVQDNDLFDIDQTGVITNNSDLELGKYHIIFSVNDTLGYTFDKYYNFRVVENPTIDPTTEENGTNGFELVLVMISLLVLPILGKKK